MRNKPVTQKDILFFSLSMFVIVVLWISFNVYHAWVTSTIAPDLQLQIVPISPNFDTKTLKALKTREKIEPSFEFSNQFDDINNIDVTASPSATSSPDDITPTEEPLPSDQPLPSDEQVPIEEEPTLAP